ncbi:hypothetical protein [Nannocystis punicea]|uniref:PQQ-like domain-containing protein n=1 Tax=Nannocystis punicea TaxID=2995304 RepID=A0ABY7HBC6_9BACT|nr:hypothetical protein [Nannocystis poenicansa]WAS96576.1 hypothetical protein O0S08_10495 [Nannocystis poenicansa]
MSLLARVAVLVLALAAAACVAANTTSESAESSAPRPSVAPEVGARAAQQGAVEPRAVIATVTEANGPVVSLGVYDRTGTKLAELLPAGRDGAWTAFTSERSLELGSPASARDRWGYHVLLPVEAIDGAPPPATASTFLLASRHGERPQQVLGLEPTGQRRFAWTIDPRWIELSPSPRGLHVFAGDGRSQGAVFEAATGRLLWEGALVGGAFAADDGAFIHVDADERHDVVIQPLPGGTPQVIAQPPALVTVAEPGSVHGPGASFLVPALSTPHGQVFRVQGDVTFGTFLFALQAGRFEPLSGSVQRFADERPVALEDDGAVVVFARRFTDGPRKPATPRLLAYDLRTGAREARPLPREDDRAALLRRVEPFFARIGGAHGWLPHARRLEVGGRRLLVGSLQWGLNPLPQSHPDPGYVVLREDGTPLALLPAGEAQIDRTGTMLLHEAWSDHARPRQVSLVDLRDGTRATIDRAVGAAFVHDVPR